MEFLNRINYVDRKVILVTAHRRENIGQPLYNICNAIKYIADIDKSVLIIYPVHLNPAVRNIVFSVLSDNERIILCDPLNVLDMHNLLSRCYMVMTDSGGGAGGSTSVWKTGFSYADRNRTSGRHRSWNCKTARNGI